MFIRGISRWWGVFFFFFFFARTSRSEQACKMNCHIFLLTRPAAHGLRWHWPPLSWRKDWVDSLGMGVCWLESAQAPPRLSMLSVRPKAQPTEMRMGRVWAGEWLQEPPCCFVQLRDDIGCEATWSSTRFRPSWVPLGSSRSGTTSRINFKLSFSL